MSVWRGFRFGTPPRATLIDTPRHRQGRLGYGTKHDTNCEVRGRAGRGTWINGVGVLQTVAAKIVTPHRDFLSIFDFRDLLENCVDPSSFVRPTSVGCPEPEIRMSFGSTLQGQSWKHPANCTGSQPERLARQASTRGRDKHARREPVLSGPEPAVKPAWPAVVPQSPTVLPGGQAMNHAVEPIEAVLRTSCANFGRFQGCECQPKPRWDELI